ncbi:sensor domain-containing diguanylate cyclase [Azonexus hydrophilus]|nr:diguanylate cyclase [Azonexus hydrophilus]
MIQRARRMMMHQRYPLPWLFLIFCLLAGNGELHAGHPALNVSMLERSTDGWQWLAPQARFAEEATPHEHPQQVLSSAALRWQKVSDAVLNVGFGPPRYWIHLSLHNPEATVATRIIEVAEPLYDDLHFWVLRDNKVFAEARMGDRIAFASRAITYRHPSMSLDIPPRTTVDLLIRAHARDGEHDPLPLRLWTSEGFQAGMQLDLLIYGAYYGAIVILLLYNLLVFASTREQVFLWYAVYLTSFLAWNFVYRGFAFQYLWPESPDWNAGAVAILVPLALAGLTAFSWSLLDLRRQTPWLFRIALILTLAALIHIPMALLAPETGLFASLNPLGLVLITTLLIAGICIAQRGNTTARIYVAAIGCTFVGTLPYYFTAFGLLPANMLTIHAINIGSALEFLLLALALAHRINSLKTEKLEAELLAHATLKHSAEALEEKVFERTSELEQANRSLHELAVRDALTGLYNRRHFNEVVQQELARSRRHGKPAALLLLDLDHFKKLNDLSGHLAGDEALAHIGQLLSSFARRSVDQAFRVGGEEFALLSPEADEENVERWAEQLRLRIDTTNWPHPGTPQGHLTASIGVALSQPGDTLESFYTRTDRALYRAKQEGRNRVIRALSDT